MKNTRETMGETITAQGSGVAESPTIKEYADAWNAQIESLQGLKWNLSRESAGKLDQLNNELRVLLYEATKNLREARKEVRA